MAGRTVWTTVVNHVEADIAAQPDAVWAAILDEYAEAGKFRAPGASVERLEDPGHPLGAYRTHMVEDGVVEDRLVLVTERDATARRLSLWVRNHDDADGVTDIYATYQARATARGTCYHLDCHSRVRVEVPDGDPRPHVTATVDRLTSEFGDYLAGYLDDVRRKVEVRG